LCRVSVMCTAPVRCCSPRLPGGWCCLERTLLTLIERCVVRVVLVCWLRLGAVSLSVVLGAFGALSLLAFHPYNSFCLLSVPLSIVTAPASTRHGLMPCAQHILNKQCSNKDTVAQHNVHCPHLKSHNDGCMHGHTATPATGQGKGR
jgi:hypothetical protein